MTTFVVCYLVFIFFPVAGPYYVFPRPDPWFLDNAAARLVYDTLAERQLLRRGVPELARRGDGRRRARRLARLAGAGMVAAAADGAAHGRRGLLPDALRGGRARGAAGRGRSVARLIVGAAAARERRHPERK